MKKPMFTTNELRMINEALSRDCGYYSSPTTSLSYAWRELSSKVKTELVDSKINPNFDENGEAIVMSIYDMTDQDKQDLIHEVKRWANANYEIDGWDILVECFSDDEIGSLIDNSITRVQAIRKCREYVKDMDIRRKDIQATAF